MPKIMNECEAGAEAQSDTTCNATATTTLERIAFISSGYYSR